MERTPIRGWMAAVAALAIWECSGTAIHAQQPPAVPRPGLQVAQNRPGPRNRNPINDARGDDELSLEGVFLPPDRAAKRRLELARQMITEARYGEAARLLGSLLENSEDYFFRPNPEQPLFRSLKAEAGRLVASMPAAGRESYELQFGARARQMLRQAVATGSPAELAEISRRFFCTQAGQEATFLLARQHLDQNRPLAAALCLERLRESPSAQRLEPVLSLSLATCWLRAGQPEKAKDALVRAKRHARSGEVTLAGKTVKLFNKESQALAWMNETLGPQSPRHPVEADQWVLFRGDESRNAASLGGQPLLNVRWRQRTADDRTVEKLVNKVRQEYANQDIAAMPSLHPLALADVVLMRTAFAIQAVDFESGKLVWRYPAKDGSLEQFLKAGSNQQNGQANQVLVGLEQRVWDDATYGTLSSDGSQVYYVEDLGLFGVAPSPLRTVLPNGQWRLNSNARNTNRLAARELRTEGKLKWEVGGVTGEDEPKLAGAFFLGPPLPLLGHLYALAEMKQEVRLVVLSAATGALEWSQQLAVVGENAGIDTFRRNSGAAPSFADGILVCPTSAGAVVAIDLTTRSLLWGYQYPRLQAGIDSRFNTARLAAHGNGERRGSEHWVDATITVAEGRVLLTPVETDQLYCLNLLDGKELWKQERGDNVYVACVHRGNVVLVGRDSISAVRLSNGEKAWPDIPLPSGSLPAGRGFYTGDDYYLPLSTAEVAKVSLRTGRIESRARSRAGNVPGNLVCYRGSIVSQGVDFLDVYYQLDALKRQIATTLETTPDDPKALAGLGEVKLDQGSLAEAIDLFRRSYRIKPEQITREQLVDSLLQGLRADFKAHRGNLDELEQLINQKQQRLAYLRVKGLGLQAAGEVLPAFETYLQLADQETPAELDAIGDGLSVLRDRWIRAQLDQLHAAASAEQRSQIDAAIDERLKSALASETAEALRSFIAYFGGHTASDRAREALVVRLAGGDFLERELLLRQLEHSAVELRRAGAVAALAALMQEANRPELAATYYQELGKHFANVACLGGQTGQQLIDALPQTNAARLAMAADTGWPLGHAVAQEKDAVRANNAPRLPRAVDLDVVGPSGPFFEQMTISLDPQQCLIGQDGFGERRFRIPLYEQGARRFSPLINRYNGYNSPALNYVSTNGNLLMLSLGNQLLAIDTLRTADGTANRILWTQELNEQLAGVVQNAGIHSREVAVAWGPKRYVTEDANGRRLGTIGPVNYDGVYFQRGRDLHCVDPLSGKTIWTRKNVGMGNDLFGDAEFLVVAVPGDGESLLLRAATGEKLGTRRIAPFEKRMTTLGRLVLSWEAGEQQVLHMRDPWQDQTLWSHAFAPGSKAAVLSQQVVGVMQPDGEFALVTLSDGKLLVKERLEPEKALVSIYLLRAQDQYLLITNATARNDSGVIASPIPSAANNPLVSGRIYAFDSATGKKMWAAPAVISQHGLLLSQPSQLPVLVFVRQVHRPVTANARDPKTSVQMIDKRTGRVVYENEQLQGMVIGNFELSGDPIAKTVTLALQSKVITLTFSEMAVPEAAPPKTSSRPRLPRAATTVRPAAAAPAAREPVPVELQPAIQ